MTSKPHNLCIDLGDLTEPKYERLKRHLLSQVSNGHLKPGQLLPTEVQLAEYLSISRTTVRQALTELERGGLVRRVRGKGTFISESAAGAIPSDASSGGPPRIAKSTGQPVAAPGQRQEISSLYGLVLPEVHHGFYPTLQRSFSGAADRLRRQVIVCNTDQDTLRQADVLLQLADRRVCGIAMVPTSHPEAPTRPHQIRPLQMLGIPLVFCHRGVEGIRAPLVTFSGIEVGRAAGRAMIRRGHRRIALFGTHRSEMTDFYLQGLHEVLDEAGVELPARNIFYGTRVGHTVTAEHESAVRGKLEELFASSEPPTAIFTSFDSEAELIFLLLTTQLGLNVPGDVSLVGVGGSWRVSAVAQRLTSVVVDEDEIGRRAVDVLDQMQRGERPPDDAEVSVVGVSVSDGKTLDRPGGSGQAG